MKKVLCVSVILFITMLLVPLGAISGELSGEEIIASVNANAEREEKTQTVKVYDKTEEKINSLSVDEYIFGVVAAEMPILYGEEALKAQAVASYTFLLFRKNENSEKEYDITTDYTVDQSFITREKAKENWGEKAEEYEQKLDKAIKEVSGYALTYDSLPILAAYCASTAGKTQNAKDVWGGEYPYLAAVNSEWDRLDKNNSSTATFSANDLKQKLSTLAEISGEESKWFCDIVKNSSGYVSKLTLCGKEVTGSEIRKALDLKSSAFDITLKDGNFVFSVRGYGHGVGMSQVGAGKMAENGSAYEEILTHYYSGCIVEKIN